MSRGRARVTTGGGRQSRRAVGGLWWGVVEGGSRQAALADGLKWIVMHESDYPDRQFARTARFLDITATPVYEGEGLRIYRLDPITQG